MKDRSRSMKRIVHHTFSEKRLYSSVLCFRSQKEFGFRVILSMQKENLMQSMIFSVHVEYVEEEQRLT